MCNHEKGQERVVNMKGQVRKYNSLLKVKHQHSPGQTAWMTTSHLQNMEQVC